MADDPEHIPGWQRLDARVTTSGRLKPDDVPRLAAIGVRHVINLALADSPGALAGEDALMAEQGLRYTHIPVPFDAPTEEQYRAFREAFRREAEAVHVHCIMNWRVSAFFYRYNREQGMPEAEARALMERQWSPETNESKDAPAWAAFVAKGGD
jgi:protein tyrosine phosphatase (PTP) superfamily phosphohydrolase (DUF442 family)